MEVLDLGAKRLLKSVTGLHEPQGIRYLPDRKRVAVANGGNGAVVFLDGGTFANTATATTAGDADNVRYDQKSGRVYVGYGNGGLAIFDADGKPLATLAVGGHPESFQLEANGPRIFVNVPGAHQIAVIDRDKHAVVATWPVTAAASNYPMALDEAHQRLFVGCRQPARMLVYDTTKGAVVTSIEIVGDTDDLFYDDAKHRVYVIGGEGFVTVIEQQDADRYRQIDRIPTAAGARTGLFVPELGKLFVAVPHRGAQSGEVRTFATGGV
jgi:DNA-binding beta-propeller fold protein YncE